MCLNRLFSMKELEELDEKQLAIRDDAIKLEIRTSAEIRQDTSKENRANLQAMGAQNSRATWSTRTA
jgi:hypothetical protein